MTTIEQLIEVFKTGLTGVNVYSGTIPATAVLPAIAIYNVSFTSNRVLSGNKTKRVSNWRITLVDTVQHLQTVIDAVELLDNTSNQYFQKMFVLLTLIEPKAPTEPHQRAFIDVTIYPK